MNPLAILECYFYDTIANSEEFLRAGVRIPKAYGVFYDKDDPQRKRFCLVMEDLGADTWIAKAHMPFDTMYRLLENAAKLHGESVNTFTHLNDCLLMKASFWDMPVREDTPGLGLTRHAMHREYSHAAHSLIFK